MAIAAAVAVAVALLLNRVHLVLELGTVALVALVVPAVPRWRQRRSR